MSLSNPDESPTSSATFHINGSLPGPVTSTNRPLQACYDQGINKISDTDTHGIQSPPSVLPPRFHRRRSSLSQVDYPVEESVPKVVFEKPVFEDSLPTTLAEREREQSAETKASQKQADDAHIMAHSDRRAREKVAAQAWVHHDDDLYNKSHVRDEAGVKDSG
ncbi:hypothetical protein LTR99_003613 [Exophiala xenobiotica]|uniref:Uncharacterized protein n=1 Tax=Vermiconidia calcicola TaxID=1690605 RepID=A0AAV9Q1J4_9PEZI|nr:hypothetical protein LTR99_003613 [Exophiala xenobiotica]KAK5435083.1 hypothetical protein LTR34_002584 [Exophiala xenobiotica]KAK5531308.1 hypothetical protein LTR25_008415 [Vermiconidia calcicola]